MKGLLAAIGLGTVLVVVLSACTAFGQQPQAPAAPDVNITNVQPSGGESGLAVLLTFAGIGAFLFAIGMVVLGMLWYNERRRRTTAESVVFSVTGHTMDRLVLAPIGAPRVPEQRMLTQGVSHER